MTGTTAIAPLKFISGDLLSSPEQGAVEHKDNDYYATVQLSLYTSEYPPAYTDTYVKATTEYDASYIAAYSTDPNNSLIGTHVNNQWLSTALGSSNQRFHIDLGAGKTITRIYYENSHVSGLITKTGAKNFTLWGSNEASAFAELTFGIDTNWTQLTTDVSQFEQHIALDQADPKYIYVTNTTSYRYYAFKFTDNWGGSYMGVRRIELQLGGSGNPRKGIILNNGSNLTETYVPVATTNGRLMDGALTQVNSEIYYKGEELDARYLNISGDTILGNLTVTGDTSLQSLTATSISSSTIVYRSQEIDDRFVNSTGDTMTGDLFVNANLTVTGNTFLQATSATTLTATTVNITSFTSATETLVTTSGSSLLQNYLTTDIEFVTNSTVLTNILSTSNWLYNNYTGSTMGLVEGQKYACCNYLYVYTNSILYRYKNSNSSISTYSAYASASTNSDIIIVSASTAFTLMMPPASSLILGECVIKNIGSANVTISATTSTFDGDTSLVVPQWNTPNLFAYNNNYLIF
jgi:hypothetical protein